LKKYAEELSDAAGKSIFETKYGETALAQTTAFIKYALAFTQDAYEQIQKDKKVDEKYGDAFSDDLAFFTELNALIDQRGYAEIAEKLTTHTTITPQTLRGYPEFSNIRAVRKSNYEDLEKIKKDYFRFSDAEIEKSFRENSEICLELYSLLKEFDKRFMSEKASRGICSFADIRRFVLEILCDENGAPTPTALEYRDRFDYIYIDEYQDVNSVQDAIFRMIAAPNTRFMVGDIKQSIYGFRGAEPALFGAYRENFDDYTEDKEATDRGCKIFLSNNFRSSDKILTFANAVSRTCFEKGDSSIEYVDGDDLVYSKSETDTQPVTVALIAKNEEKSAEAAYVCDRIEELLAKGSAPSDIAIMLRSLSSSALPFTRELEKRGIPYYCDVKREFFDNPEIMLALCWLNAIDNTRRDVFVCGIAKSPVYDITLDELIRVRREAPADTLFNSIKEYCATRNFEKGSRFIKDIESLRRDARGMSAHELLWKLIYQKGLMSVVTKDKNEGEAKVARNNLLLFYDYAKNFENGEFKGVYNFLAYIEKVIDAGQALPAAAAFAGSGNAVKIMTVHHSKGLEFPYCFLCSCDKNTSTQDMKEKLYFHPDFGIAAKIADQT
ncbi:MAG: UvrD-helicase domain-containing protein, partial [Clostridia bacterium]|nr:UvrD-helicase domain-containing protein [Clostridia bacterium]